MHRSIIARHARQIPDGLACVFARVKIIAMNGMPFRHNWQQQFDLALAHLVVIGFNLRQACKTILHLTPTTAHSHLAA